MYNQPIENGVLTTDPYKFDVSQELVIKSRDRIFDLESLMRIEPDRGPLWVQGTVWEFYKEDVIYAHSIETTPIKKIYKKGKLQNQKESRMPIERDIPSIEVSVHRKPNQDTLEAMAEIEQRISEKQLVEQIKAIGSKALRLVADRLHKEHNCGAREHDTYKLTAWQKAVSSGKTQFSYWEWVAYSITKDRHIKGETTDV